MVPDLLVAGAIPCTTEIDKTLPILEEFSLGGKLLAEGLHRLQSRQCHMQVGEEVAGSFWQKSFIEKVTLE